MTNILGDEKKQQVLALGRLGWPLRRIEEATGVRRETASAYLRAAGIAVRPARAWGHPPKPASGVSTDPANPASEVSTDSGPSAAASAACRRGRRRPAGRPTASACEPYRELIELALGRGRNAMAIWQDLVDRHGFPARYASVRRFVVKLRGPAPARGAPGDRHRAGRGRPGRLRRRPDGAASRARGKYRRTRLFVFTLGYSRKSVRLLTFASSARRWAELHEEAFRRLGGGRARRRPRQSQGRRAHARHLRPDAQPALPRRARPLRRRRAALPRRRSRSQGQGRVGHRPHPGDAAQGPALRDARRGPGVSRSLGGALGRHPHPRHHEAPGRRHVRRGAAAAPAAARWSPSATTSTARRTVHLDGCVEVAGALLRAAAGLARPRGRRAVGRPATSGSSIRPPAACSASIAARRAGATSSIRTIGPPARRRPRWRCWPGPRGRASPSACSVRRSTAATASPACAASSASSPS